jgi:hypothetical protein
MYVLVGFAGMIKIILIPRMESAVAMPGWVVHFVVLGSIAVAAGLLLVSGH